MLKSADVPFVVTPLRMIFSAPIEDPVGLEIVSVELDAVVCVAPTEIAPPPEKVCWALTAAGSSRLTRARARRLTLNWANRRGDTKRARNDIMETSGHRKLWGALGKSDRFWGCGNSHFLTSPS
jgi:hypothetical protein